MNFQTLTKIEDPDFYLDLAFRRAKEKLDQERGFKFDQSKFKSRIDKSKHLELLRVEVTRVSLCSSLDKIIKSYPDLGKLPKFYHELVRCTLDYDDVKRSLGAVQWAKNNIQKFALQYKDKIKKAAEMGFVNKYRREFLGRSSSVLRQIKNELLVLEDARKVMKDYPTVKTSLPTVAIIGFPNVGKTTLLYKLTGSKPEIKAYAFTTKGVNIGNIKTKDTKIQFLDTPGTLNRFNKMNNMERIAFLAMKYVAHKLVYIFDLTETYPIEKQVKLYETIKELKKDIIVFLSKQDIIDKSKLLAFAKKYDALTDVKKLKEKLLA